MDKYSNFKDLSKNYSNPSFARTSRVNNQFVLTPLPKSYSFIPGKHTSSPYPTFQNAYIGCDKVSYTVKKCGV